VENTAIQAFGGQSLQPFGELKGQRMGPIWKVGAKSILLICLADRFRISCGHGGVAAPEAPRVPFNDLPAPPRRYRTAFGRFPALPRAAP